MDADLARGDESSATSLCSGALAHTADMQEQGSNDQRISLLMQDKLGSAAKSVELGRSQMAGR